MRRSGGAYESSSEKKIAGECMCVSKFAWEDKVFFGEKCKLRNTKELR